MLDARLNHAVAVAQTGSFTKAADLVGLTQSGITKSIADLEKELGFAIFYRTSRGAIVTESGREFVERASRLLEDAEALLHGGRGHGDPYADVLRIGVCPASVEWMLATPIADLLSRHPNIRLDIIATNYERVVELLRNGSVDIAFGFEAAFSEWKELQCERVTTLQADIFVRRGHPLLSLDKISRRNLADYDFVAPSDSRPYGMVIRGLYDENLSTWNRRIHVIDNFSVVKRVVATTDAIGVTTVQYAAARSFLTNFERVPGIRLFEPAPLCCAVRTRWEPKPSARAFRSALKTMDQQAMSLPHGTTQQ